MSAGGVRTRFAPSPTGVLHIGSARTALFSMLYARHHGGAFILRIEDTDRARSTEASVQVILDGLDWLDLEPDEGPFFQSRNLDRYRQVAGALIEAGQAYRCYCTPEELDAMRAEQAARGLKPRYDGRCRSRRQPREGVPPVIRFRNPETGLVHVDDLVHGRVSFDNGELDDLVILRSDGSPTYHFTVVVDDADMGVSHVIRGDDHLNNTPRQLNLFRALRLEPPRYAHIPMIVGPDGAKLSKRRDSVNILAYREQGYLPEAMLNYLVRLGWAAGDQEIFTLDEMIELFDLDGVQKSAARFDLEKLNWLNQHYVKAADGDRLVAAVKAQLEALGVEHAAAIPLAAHVEAYRERAVTLREMAQKIRVYIEEPVQYHADAAAKFLQRSSADVLASVRDGLAALDQWSEEATQAVVASVAEAAGLKMGKVAQPVRVAVTGGTASPGIGVTLHILGREKTLARLDRAIEHVRSSA